MNHGNVEPESAVAGSRPSPSHSLDDSIPSYEDSVLGLRAQDHGNLDALLAAQFALADNEADLAAQFDLADNEEADVLSAIRANYTTRTPPFTTGAATPGNSYHDVPDANEGEESDDDDLLNELTLAARARETVPVRGSAECIRNRYDVAGIPTYRLDPRRGQSSLYSRYRRTSGNVPQTASADNQRNASSRPTAEAGNAKPSPLDPSRFFQVLKHVHPVLNPESGAPLVNILTADALTHIIDRLYFPDVFAFALTCKAVHSRINLQAKKREYTNALLYIGKLSRGHDLGMSPALTGLCDACLYDLPLSYFKPRSSEETKLECSTTCADCMEFRQRLATAQCQAGANDARMSTVWVTWRPSQRVTVSGTGGFLWYRKRA